MNRHLVVQLVTPAMIGGAVARQCDDPPTLRPPSLRGHLRFWSRALGGDQLANELWGEVNLGQRVRLAGNQRLKQPKDALLIPSKATTAPMVPPGDQVVLRFGIPESVSLERLQAVVWTWLHLGTVGRRSRRGYGSLQWLPSTDDLLAGWPPLWPSHHLHDRGTLEAYLKAGLTRVAGILGCPGTGPRTAGDTLTTLDQVFIGKELPGVWEAAEGPDRGAGEALESLVHGLNEKGRGVDPDSAQLGSAKPRLPSPILWRLFPVAKKKAFLPVMTWFPTGYASGTPQLQSGEGVYKYLQGRLGFEKSLTGADLAR